MPKMNCLYEALNRRNEEPFLFYRERWYDCAELRQMVAGVRASHPGCRGQKVMVKAKGDCATVLALLAFENFAAELLIVSSDLSADLELHYLKEGGFTQTITVDDSCLDYLPSDASKCDQAEIKTFIVIPTSGTTGVPKLVLHTYESLTSTVKIDPDKGRFIIWGMLYSISRFAGIQVFLQAFLGGGKLVLLGGRSSFDNYVDAFQAAGVNALSATPTMWKKMELAGVLDHLTFRLITLGGEIADQPILDQLAKRYPDARITSVYASTEAGVGFSVTDRLAGFPIGFTEGSLPNGVRLKVQDDLLFLAKVTASAVYKRNDLTIQDEDGWINTGDLVEKSGDRYLFLGRENGSINVGGQKVHPAEVEGVIMEFPGISLVVVYARKNPIIGNLVEAQIVLDEGSDRKVILNGLKLHCRERLERFKVPAIIKTVDQLFTNETGKIKRSNLT